MFSFNESDIFKIHAPHQFNDLALKIFHYQAENCEVYKNYLFALGAKIDKISKIEQIPFLPIEFFKSHKITTNNLQAASNALVFTSSGTTGEATSKHFVSDVGIYKKSFSKGFFNFYGSPSDYCILALLPSYLERDGSSLIFMTEELVKGSKHPKSGFFLHNHEDLFKSLQELNAQNKKSILIGVTYALLDFAERFPISLGNTIVMETGGMKGKRKEMLREEVHAILKKSFQISEIHSEYGMTELLSQAYSKGNGRFSASPWMKILIRDTNDPFKILEHEKSGGINVIDFANIYSCSFIATQDLGKLHSDNSFEVLGRFDNSDIRGCNLMIQ